MSCPAGLLIHTPSRARACSATCIGFPCRDPVFRAARAGLAKKARTAGLEPAAPGLEGRFLPFQNRAFFGRTRTHADSTSGRSLLKLVERGGSLALQNHLQWRTVVTEN